MYIHKCSGKNNIRGKDIELPGGHFQANHILYVLYAKCNVTDFFFAWGGEKKGEGRKTERQNKNKKKKHFKFF